MIDLILWPFKFALSMLNMLFNLITGILGAVFGLVGGVLNFIISGALSLILIIGVLALVRWVVRTLRSV